MSDLKPCPFCGAAAAPHGPCAIECSKCDALAMGPKSQVVGRWNRRAEPPVLDCRRCGGKNVRVYELDGQRVVECSSCCATWNLEAPHA